MSTLNTVECDYSEYLQIYGHQHAPWNHRTEVKCDKINSARIQNLCFELSTTNKRADIWFRDCLCLKFHVLDLKFSETRLL